MVRTAVAAASADLHRASSLQQVQLQAHGTEEEGTWCHCRTLPAAQSKRGHH
jgi:hypothetical protein